MFQYIALYLFVATDNGTDRVRVVVALHTCVQDVFGSNLG
jgi:hypothetical protein